MWKLTDLNKERKGINPLFERFEHYVAKKNLNFIVAREKCVNLGQDTMGPAKVAEYLTAYAGCDFSMIALFNDTPKTPFIATNMDIANKIARVQYIIDFNKEAETGKASPFYSKVLGAFATHFFAACPQIEQLWFPFVIENIVGSKMAVQPNAFGTAILR